MTGDTAREGRRVTDPERIRALAHPVRLELLDYLVSVDEATATECAAHTGESVASCSFHLRMLAKYGYIARTERRGREKPWRALQSGWDMRPTAEQPGSRLAVAELAALRVLAEGERLRRFLGRLHREDEQWVHASTITTGSFWATAEEMEELSRDLREITARFAGRSDDPAKRPPAARKGWLFATVNPEPLPDAGDE